MSEEDGNSTRELEWLIEDRKRRIEDIETQLAEKTDAEVAKGLKGVLAMLRDEIAGYERELDENGPFEEDPKEYIQNIDERLNDIGKALENETDPVVRNNLEVSKRFLQMERNHALIEMTQKTERNTDDERIAELERSLASSRSYADDLRVKLERAEKEREHYRVLAENPDRRADCDTTRVYIEAGTLKDLRNRAKVLELENGNLRRENKALKEQIGLMHKDIGELTKHCKEGDSQILVLQKRLATLREKLGSDNSCD